jgi:hypothetical protein
LSAHADRSALRSSSLDALLLAPAIGDLACAATSYIDKELESLSDGVAHATTARDDVDVDAVLQRRGREISIRDKAAQLSCSRVDHDSRSLREPLDYKIEEGHVVHGTVER